MKLPQALLCDHAYIILRRPSKARQLPLIAGRPFECFLLPPWDPNGDQDRDDCTNSLN
jgi:hypothetical protein